MVCDPAKDDSSTSCWCRRQAAHVLFAVAINVQKGFTFLASFSDELNVPTARSASGRPVVAWNASSYVRYISERCRWATISRLWRTRSSELAESSRVPGAGVERAVAGEAANVVSMRPRYPTRGRLPIAVAPASD